MKPKPFSALNHFTVPVITNCSLQVLELSGAGRHLNSRAEIWERRLLQLDLQDTETDARNIVFASTRQHEHNNYDQPVQLPEPRTGSQTGPPWARSPAACPGDSPR